MDGFLKLFTELIIEAGMEEKYIFQKRYLELPGFFRPTKEWDLLVVKDNYLIAAIEAKSQVGTSFGNNSQGIGEGDFALILTMQNFCRQIRNAYRDFG